MIPAMGDQGRRVSAPSEPGRDSPESAGAADVFAHEIHELLFDLLLRLRGQVESATSAHGLSQPQFLVLRTLAAPRSMGELAGALRCDASNITGIIDRLEERGLVERRVASDDRRVKNVVLTREGERLRGQLQRQIVERSQVVTALTAAERYALVSLLRRMTATR
ncbi:MAG: MarR family transcriptional regulator [Actinomycetota bacterium]|nr:MarR family transcriptional regulator [Actinomycetota bacterium]